MFTSRSPSAADDSNANANDDAALNLLTTPDIRRKRPRCDGHGDGHGNGNDNGNDNDNDDTGIGADASASASAVVNVKGESFLQDNISRNDSIHNPMLSAVSSQVSVSTAAASASASVAVVASASSASRSTSRFHTPILVQSQGYG